MNRVRPVAGTLALLLVLAGVLAVTACGRKGPLETPPPAADAPG